MDGWKKGRIEGRKIGKMEKWSGAWTFKSMRGNGSGLG